MDEDFMPCVGCPHEDACHDRGVCEGHDDDEEAPAHD